ncbi:MAG: MvaI/BcnI family restriction endonuclease [Deltaproteobacteria bacterium]|nr:MvaI/BcnI family restriction endonuclease [Deltaproteobacteria bacterium]MCL5277285.1 MvaI/BcnI family restriction endonuclease [Deltaproteobacteria bacterium]
MPDSVQELKEKLEAIKSMGFIKTHRAYDTGVGKTLEDLLSIEENNIRLPDIGDIELKTKRITSDSMLTLATKAPRPKGINRKLFEQYKYKDDEGYYNLHSTVYGSKVNPQGFKMIYQNGKLFLENKRHIEAYWDENIFEDVLVSKSNKILLAFAETKGEPKSSNEYFHFIEAYLLQGLNRDKFRNAIEKDYLKVDIRIGVYHSGKNKGKHHDHGTGFRMHKRDFLKLYDRYEQLL